MGDGGKLIADNNRLSIDRKRIMLWIEYFVRRYCQPDWECIPQVICFTNLVYVVDGKGTYTINGVEYPVGKGDLIYIRTGSHRMAQTDPVNRLNLFAIDFHMYDIRGKVFDFDVDPVNHLGMDTYLLRQLNRLNSVWTIKDQFYDITAVSIMYKIIEYLARRKNSSLYVEKDMRVQIVTDFILTNIYRKISAKELADLVHLQPNYLNVIIKSNTGMTLKNYVNYLKMNYAENVLKNEELTVNEAADAVGFNDSAYFSRIFKLFKGFPPSAAKYSQ